MPPGKASTLLSDLSDYWLTAQVRVCPGKVVHVKSTIHMSLIGLVGLSYLKHVLDVMMAYFWVKVP